MSDPYQTYDEWIKSLNDKAVETQPQEPQVNETTQELPAVSTLRQAFDTARNAIIEGSELAKQVEGLRKTVDQLSSEVSLLQRDLEYVRSRNKELDEQVTEVRRQRDQAISEGLAYKERADVAEAGQHAYLHELENTRTALQAALDRKEAVSRERDDAMVMALEYEGKLKEAQAKLTKIEELAKGVFGWDVTAVNEDLSKPKPHYLEQPRDEVGKFQPIEPKTHDSGSQGSF